MGKMLDKNKKGLSNIADLLDGAKNHVQKLVGNLNDLRKKILQFLYMLINKVSNFINDKFHTKIPSLGGSKADKEKEELDELIKLSGVSGVSSDSFKKENLSTEDRIAIEKAKEEIEKRKRESKKRLKLVFIILAVIIGIIFIIIFSKNASEKAQKAQEIDKQVQKVRRMNLSSELSGSGTLSAKDSYNITSLVEGDVIYADFNEGDIVDKDQLLIVVEPSTARRSVINASASYIKAKQDYDDAKEKYDKVIEKYEDNICHSDLVGYYKSVNIKTGDVLSSKTVIGTLFDDTIMTVSIPFLSSDAKNIRAGMAGTLILAETDELLAATVTVVGSMDSVLNGGSLVRYVSFNVKNPGGLTEDNNASAVVGNFISVGDGAFAPRMSVDVTLDDGDDVKVDKVFISKGSYVTKGTPLFSITQDSYKNVISSKRNSYQTANNQLIQAENSLKNSEDNYNEYYIKAPIEGTVISKNVKTGDKLQKTNTATTLATIYDLSELYFDMSIDELDITKVSVGQKVNVQADAFNNKVFSGEITKVSLVAANSNGVTSYPVRVTITETGDLIPGMNVDGYVILASRENVLTIPSDALQRGNVVYVKKTSNSVNGKKVDQTGIGQRVLNNTPDGFVAVKVTTGISNDNFIEIVEGLEEDDEIYVNETSSQNQMGFGGFGGPGMGGMGGPPGGARR